MLNKQMLMLQVLMVVLAVLILMAGAVAFGECQGGDAWRYARLNIGHRVSQRLVNANDDVGPRLGNDLCHFLDEFTRFVLPRVWNAILKIELNGMSAPCMGLVDVF